MSKERDDLTAMVKKEKSLSHEQKLLLLGVMKGMRLANAALPKAPHEAGKAS